MANENDSNLELFTDEEVLDITIGIIILKLKEIKECVSLFKENFNENKILLKLNDILKYTSEDHLKQTQFDCLVKNTAITNNEDICVILSSESINKDEIIKQVFKKEPELYDNFLKQMKFDNNIDFNSVYLEEDAIDNKVDSSYIKNPKQFDFDFN